MAEFGLVEVGLDEVGPPEVRFSEFDSGEAGFAEATGGSV